MANFIPYAPGDPGNISASDLTKSVRSWLINYDEELSRKTTGEALKKKELDRATQDISNFMIQASRFGVRVSEDELRKEVDEAVKGTSNTMEAAYRLMNEFIGYKAGCRALGDAPSFAEIKDRAKDPVIRVLGDMVLRGAQIPRSATGPRDDILMETLRSSPNQLTAEMQVSLKEWVDAAIYHGRQLKQKGLNTTASDVGRYIPTGKELGEILGHVRLEEKARPNGADYSDPLLPSVTMEGCTRARYAYLLYVLANQRPGVALEGIPIEVAPAMKPYKAMARQYEVYRDYVPGAPTPPGHGPDRKSITQEIELW